jgi:hypothetical protein
MTHLNIHERSLDDLLRCAPSLLDRQYACQADHEWGRLPHIRERIYTVAGADADGSLYLARQKVSLKRGCLDGEFGIDSDGHPHYIVRYGDRSLALYDRLFRGNTGFACAMGRLHERLIDRVYEALQAGQRTDVLGKFDRYIEGFLPRVPDLRDRLVRAYYAGMLKQEFKRLPYVDQRALGLLALKEGSADAIPLGLDDRSPGRLFRDAVKVTGRARKELFRTWYHSFIDNDAYERKIRESGRANDAAYEFYWRSLESQLARHGFRKRDRILGL